MSKVNSILRPIGKILGFENKPSKPPAPPTVNDPAVVAEREKRRLALAARRGFQSTILTPSLSEGAGTGGAVERKQLLGA